MKLVIIEDEEIVAEDLERSIRNILSGVADIVKIRSVKEGLNYFQNQKHPDLIFSDVQLGDGLSFEIFVTTVVPAPVIFSIAYGNHFLDVFQMTGIDHIMKPFTTMMLQNIMSKYLTEQVIPGINELSRHEVLQCLMVGNRHQRAASLLVKHYDKIIPVSMEDIAIFYFDRNVTHLKTFSGKCYLPDKCLDELEILLGSFFFRVNSHLLICRNAVSDVSSLFFGGLSVRLWPVYANKITVSKGLAPQFLKWLAGT